MHSPQPRHTRTIVLALAGATAFVLGAFLVLDGHILLAHYHAWRLGSAATYEEALPSLQAISAIGGKPGTSGAILGNLGPGRERLALWLFAWIDGGDAPEETLLQDFARRLERDERLLAWWSHFVRWRLGTELWSYLDSISARPEEPQAAGFPCGDGSFRSGLVQAVFSGFPTPRMAQGKPLVQALRRRGIAWFLGMEPLPSAGPDSENELAAWLKSPEPFLRHLVYDEGLGRCKRESEVDPLPTLDRFASRGLPMPSLPVPGWKGPVPDLPPLAEPQVQVQLPAISTPINYAPLLDDE